jgi:hypothetical protein
MSSTSSTQLLEGLADSVATCLDAASLRAIANLELEPRTRQRLDELADKDNEGRITQKERVEYQTFIGAKEFLGLVELRARARLGLPFTS